MASECGFQTSLETIPASIPYLHPEPSLVTKWAGRIGTEGFRTGVCWQGNKIINLQRSIPLSCFAPLAAIDGVRLISLIKNQDLIEVEAEDGRFVIEGLGDDFDSGADSFVDCAAVMEYVDIIVTSDTAIAHLGRNSGELIRIF